MFYAMARQKNVEKVRMFHRSGALGKTFGVLTGLIRTLAV